MVYYLIALIVFLIIKGTKYVIATRLELGEQIPVINDFFIITSHRNSGAAFGILEGQQWFFFIVTVVVVVGIVWYMNKAKASRKLLPTALALVLGGAIGNFLDRMLNGEVVDFLMFNFGSYTFPIFNVADSCIVIGVGLIILDTLLDMKSGDEIIEVKESKEVKEGNE